MKNQITMENKIHIAKTHWPVTSLGVGRRLAIWTMGCFKRCSGCVSPEFQKQNGGLLYSVSSFFNIARFAIGNEKLSGITITGGEPLLQWRALRKCILKLKEEFSVIDTLVYTGFAYAPNDVLNFADMDEKINLDWIDILVDGEFQMENPAKDFIRGSENQNIYTFSELGKSKLDEMQKINYFHPKIQMFQEEDLFFGGIPKPDFPIELYNILLQKNIQLKK